ncbi:DUF6265 family protein [Congregibacter variabilis]|uniref:DUF6265 family protein n=1 Tax=Congregibacter variabilis TaxID=3081200 RepID=A0ABZ0I115_9GAMM|nr:DUF6265 family protein [Congregibacter sp. IMCC43200]
MNVLAEGCRVFWRLRLYPHTPVQARFVFLCLLLTCPIHTRAEGVDWLVGCWESFESYSKEVWVKNPDGTLLGFSASIDGSDIAFYELLYIKEVGGTLTYTAHPSGQNPATFLVQEMGDKRVVFENPQHDYPQLISYESDGTELTAVISAMNGEKELVFKQQRCRNVAD